MGPAYLYCTDSCLLNNQELSLLKYNYTNWYCVQQFPKWWYLEILHPAPLKLALSHPGGPCCFPSGESILLLPILPYPSVPSFLTFLAWVVPLAYWWHCPIHFHSQLWKAYEAFLLPIQPKLWDFSHSDPLISLMQGSTWKPRTSLCSCTLLNCLLSSKVECAGDSHLLLDTHKGN